MALNTLNSVGGFSVGVSEAEVISANGNISTGNLTVNTAGVVNFTTTSNVALGNVSNLHISGGTANYVLSTDGSGTLSWVAQAGGGAISNISNGNSNVSIPAANGNVNISAVGNANVVVITGTGANITGTANITGNLTAGNIIAGSGSGGNITNANVISANTFTATGNVTGGNLTTSGALSVTGNANVGNIGAAAGVFTTVAGTLTTAAQPNITSVGTLTSLSVTGTATAGNLSTGGTLTATGNANVGNLGTGGLVVATGNVTGGNLTTSGALSVTGNANTGNLGTTTLIATTGNITTINSGLIQNGNSNIAITSNGNVSIQAAGSTVELVVTSTGANISGTLNATGNANVGNIGAAEGVFTTVAGTLTTAAQPNITSVGTLTSLVVTGNISSGNANLGNAATANFFIGSGANLSNLPGANVSGQVSNATVAGTVYTNAQPNITSVGSLSGLTVSNATGIVNFTTTANVTLGAVANLHIAGGSNGQYLQTDGAGTLTWSTVTSGSTSNISNGNSNVSIPVANGNINFSAVGNANVVVVTGTGVNVAGTLNVTGQSNLGAVGNVKITGGSNAYVLQTDGAGNLSWTAQPASATITVDDFTGNGVQTIFTLSTTPTDINQTSVNYNGATVLRTDYTLANANITFSSAPANGSYIEVTTINLSSGGGGGGGSANIAIYDEGNLLTNTVSSLDFAGSGVIATSIGNAVTVTITGGGGGGPASIILDSFTGNGVQTAFALSTAPQSENYTFVNIDGVDQLKTAYSVSGSTLTFSSAPSNGANIEVTIISALSNAQPSFTTRTYTGNGVQNTFTVTNGVTSTGILVTENGILQIPGTDYNVSSANLIFTTAPANLQAIQIRELGTVVAEIASVAVANVIGIGNIATTNYNGNGSQVLAGNGAWVNSSGGGTSAAAAVGYSLIFGG